MLIQAGLLFFMLIINPFSPYTDPATGAALAPADGKGLNELLHNPWGHPSADPIHRLCAIGGAIRLRARWTVTARLRWLGAAGFALDIDRLDVPGLRAAAGRLLGL